MVVVRKASEITKIEIAKWGTAVLAVLRAANMTKADAERLGFAVANATQAELAKRLGMEPPTLNRYLAGERIPNRETVLKINRAVGRLSRIDVAGPLLDCEAMLCGLLDSSQRIPIETLGDNAVAADHSMSLDALVPAVLALFVRYGFLFRAELRDRIATHMRDSGEAAARRFAVELNREFLRIAVAELRPVGATVGFASVCEILERHGLDVTALLTADGEEMLAWDRAMWVVRRELVRANPDAPAYERLAAEKRIFDSFREHFEPRRAPQSPAPIRPQQRKKAKN